MILVTGAAGKTGRAVIRALATRQVAIRALVRRPDQVPKVEGLGAGEVLVGDMGDLETMDQAVQGVRAIYHIPPNVSPDEFTIGQTVIAAAQAAGVERFVYHSVLHPQTEVMPHHWQKLRVEEHLFESSLPFTILQPAVYMQNLLAHWDQITGQGILPVPYSVETRLSLVDLEDVAEVASLVLTNPGHLGAIYELVGTEAVSQTEIAGVLSQHLGRPVHAKAISRDSWERQARATGLGDYQVETLIKMFRYYERYGFWGNPSVLRWLLNRPPTTILDFIDCSKQQQLRGI
jgi:uncharacterized protein YbjT (DUF2867 family)